jgi:hypothetical protein
MATITPQQMKANEIKMRKLNAEVYRSTGQCPMDYALCNPSRGEFNTGEKFRVGDKVEVGAAYSFKYAIVTDTCDDKDFEGKTQVMEGSWDYKLDTAYSGAGMWIKDKYLRKIPN